MVITQKTLDQEALPFKSKKRKDFDRKQYLGEIQTRLENLYAADAFDIKAFSERLTGGTIGCASYEIVAEANQYAARLRCYALPDGIVSNGKILYLPSPLVNRPEIYDLADGKSVIQGMHQQGFTVYLVDNGDPGYEESKLGLEFYGKSLHDKNLEIIAQRHPGQEICVMAYCMGGTLILPYLARRAEERMARGEAMDIHKVALMASPVNIDDGDSGYAPVLEIIRQGHDARLMEDLFGDVNIPVQVIESGMNQTQMGVQYHVASGFYHRALDEGAIGDSAPFFFWLSHGRMFPARAHKEWIQRIFLENQIYRGKFGLPSSVPELDGQPVRMDLLTDAGVTIMDYRGTRDMISPGGACVASEIWGQTPNNHLENPPGGMNQTVEKNIGHIFVVSRKLLAEFIETVSEFLK
jgi:poly(3-hydroxyalkanoate) synthetase